DDAEVGETVLDGAHAGLRRNRRKGTGPTDRRIEPLSAEAIWTDSVELAELDTGLRRITVCRSSIPDGDNFSWAAARFRRPLISGLTFEPPFGAFDSPHHSASLIRSPALSFAGRGHRITRCPAPTTGHHEPPPRTSRSDSNAIERMEVDARTVGLTSDVLRERPSGPLQARTSEEGSSRDHDLS
ncbi:MAG: hypothetical protein RLZZ461_470, partial [Planctomycetota bacterium]